MTDRMLDLKLSKIDGADDFAGSWQLEQSNGLEGDAIIYLHPVQIRHLAELAGLVGPQPDRIDLLPPAHVRRLWALNTRIAQLIEEDELFKDLFEQCTHGAEWWHRLIAIRDQANELIADLPPVPEKG